MRWSEVCKFKNRGGLGIRDLRLMNLALGKWRLLMEESGIGRAILSARYGPVMTTSHRVFRDGSLRTTLGW